MSDCIEQCLARNADQVATDVWWYRPSPTLHPELELDSVIRREVADQFSERTIWGLAQQAAGAQFADGPPSLSQNLVEPGESAIHAGLGFCGIGWEPASRRFKLKRDPCESLHQRVVNLPGNTQAFLEDRFITTAHAQHPGPISGPTYKRYETSAEQIKPPGLVKMWLYDQL
jgi:hypothetical protein